MTKRHHGDASIFPRVNGAWGSVSSSSIRPWRGSAVSSLPTCPIASLERGARRGRVFFSDDDARSIALHLREACGREGVAVWSFCLMPNRWRLVLVPRTRDGLGRALGKAHRRYSAFVNARARASAHIQPKRGSAW